MPERALGFDLSHKDLLTSPDKIHKRFQTFLTTYTKSKATDLVSLARALDQFLSVLFSVSFKTQSLTQDILDFQTHFIRRKAALNPTYADLPAQELIDWAHKLWGNPFNTKRFYQQVSVWEKNKEIKHINRALNFCRVCLFHPQGASFRKKYVLFQLPQKLDFTPTALNVSYRENDNSYYHKNPIYRSDFSLTTQTPDAEDALRHSALCLKCHQRQKDTCRKGYPQADGSFFSNPLDQELIGCPLDQKISQMHLLYQEGRMLGALGVTMIDNPLVPLTGLRICNDCEKACIFQKQTQVDTPRVETHILDTILKIPWGVEIYLLLTRWNPLIIVQPPLSTAPVLVVGQGPAGISAAYHLLHQGTPVVAIDGMGISPLPRSWIHEVQPDYTQVWQTLDERIPLGFGGVAEYGITSRWDKNKITLVRLALERHPGYRLFGGVHFGGQVTLNDAKGFGFSHVVLATGAGQPKTLPLENALAPGIHYASDFLMNLQYQNAKHKESFTSLEIQLPLLVIGGGLTALDAATEALAYYPRLLEKINIQWEKLSHDAQQQIIVHLSPAQYKQLTQYLSHWADLNPYLNTSQWKNQLKKKMRAWGGVTLIYRKHLKEAPSFRINMQEVKHALHQGVIIMQNTVPQRIQQDVTGHVVGLDVHHNRQKKHLAAKTILTAVGTHKYLNTKEFDTRYPVFFKKKQTSFMLRLKKEDHYEKSNLPRAYPLNASTEGKKTPDEEMLGCDTKSFPFVSMIGDTHPVFSGSVVKALASGKILAHQLAPILPFSDAHSFPSLVKACQKKWVPQILACEPLNADLFHLKIQAPAAAQKAKPGHFFKVQCLTLNPKKHPLFSESLALTCIPTSSQTKETTLSFVVKAVGKTLRQMQNLCKDTPLTCVGPLGMPFPMFAEQRVLILGTGVECLSCLSLAPALKAKKSHVTTLVHYNTDKEMFWKERFVKSADRVVFSVGEKSLFQAFQEARMFEDFDAFYLLAPPKEVRLFEKNFSHPERCLTYYAGSMQCMLGVCGQCVCSVQGVPLFSCTQQYQALHKTDCTNLEKRLLQNRLQESLLKSLS